VITEDENDAMLISAAIAWRYNELPQVEAIALGGSYATRRMDPGSDIDLYVYQREPIPIDVRAEIARESSLYAEVDNRFWESGDEWIDATTGVHVDVMFRTTAWIEAQLEKVLQRHEASVGYTTCLWHNVRTSEPMFDRGHWFEDLQRYADQPYPEPLQRAIVAKNHPILRQTASSYLYQLRRAVSRGDLVSLNHRVAALLASYFDILFAVNRVLHPGEKRLLDLAAAQCEHVPDRMEREIKALIRAVSQGGEELIARAEVVIEGLDALLAEEGLLP